MPYNESLAQRIRIYFDAKHSEPEEMKIMGGLCFMVNGKMCVGVVDDRLMARIDPDAIADAFKRVGCRPMDFTGKPMKGFVFVDPVGTKTEARLAVWLDLALKFNPKARASATRISSRIEIRNHKLF